MRINDSGWYGSYWGEPPDDGDYICNCGEWRSDCLGKTENCTVEEYDDSLLDKKY